MFKTIGKNSSLLKHSYLHSNYPICLVINRRWFSIKNPEPRLVNFPVKDTDNIDALRTLSLATANQKQITSYNINKTIKNLQKHKSDTGSAAVQIGVMTEKILNFARHFAMHKKDKHSHRGFQMLVSRRRRMMQYLKRSDFQEFKNVVKELGLMKEASQLR